MKVVYAKADKSCHGKRLGLQTEIQLAEPKVSYITASLGGQYLGNNTKGLYSGLAMGYNSHLPED